jgi:transcriptional regulator with XRE-family HTH domain
MVSRAQAVDVRSKMIGVLVRAARAQAGKSIKQCAEWLGCSSYMMSQYEYGRRAISLPELELLASLFNVSADKLWDESVAEVDLASPRPPVEKLIELRHKEIGVLLRQARAEAGKTQKQCAGLLGVSTETMSKYEYGSKAIPFSHLEHLASFLEVSMSYFQYGQPLDRREQGEPSGVDLLSVEDAWSRLPEAVQAFMRDPESYPYLRIAMRLYQLPRGSLTELAEAMLSTEE